MTETGTEPRRTPHRRRRALGDFVAGQVADLQRRYRRREPAAVASLAKLRREVNAEPGVQFALSGVRELPPGLLGPTYGDEPTRAELAVSAAVSLYALHQQSRFEDPMHVDGPSFATAVALLAARSPSTEAVRRRFAAAGTAASFPELRHHTRGLVAQLRGGGIGMDYGRFADDLMIFLGPGGPQRLRGVWGRDYWRTDDRTDHDKPDSLEQQ
ncbi:type I-E CRISPR-associated protein Cse2/CasB [Glycomyces xiaoerkulensis]|uniref:type I-E CRISPR-associated protein Cse2/CasB n=1 Tax=Glycomyces xiaoerkulensis TaxID=2038139 RepID=UPI000C261ECE|nr:type I-E CRISPR-associated protein Cse2/CasB [Glycomyces xiaoerkulensis]